MVDREAARQKGGGYDRWASVHNLKQMAATHNFLMENDMLDLDKLDAAEESSRRNLSEKRGELRAIEDTIAAKKKLRKTIGEYRSTKPTIDAHKKLSGKKAEAYHRANEADFIIHESAKRRLKALLPGGKLPAAAKLNGGIEALISEKNAAYNAYDMDILPSDLALYGKEAKSLLNELQSRNERLFLVTFLVLNMADGKQKLSNDVFCASGVTQKYNCILSRLDYQQEQGLMSSLPLGLNQIKIQRALTTSSVAVFVPFVTQELFGGGQSIYYGLNAVSNNMIMLDRTRPLPQRACVRHPPAAANP